MYRELSLCFTALILTTVGGLPVTQQDCKRAILMDIQKLLNMSNNGGTFYTPKNTGVKCASVARNCFMKEIEVLEEIEDNENITNVVQQIQRNFHNCWERLEDTIKENGCATCDSYESQTSEVFLKQMITFVQNAFLFEH